MYTSIVMPAQPHTPSESWRHSVYCGVQKGFPCTCKEPTWDDGGGVTSSGREQEREALSDLRERVGCYITALMVDDGKNVGACERAMEEAFDALSDRLAKLEQERDAQAYRAEQHVRKWVESDAGKYEARAVAAEAESARLRKALEEIEAMTVHQSPVKARARAALSAVSPDGAGPPESEPFVLTLEWECQMCGWKRVVDAPGFAGDGHAHYPDGHYGCGPLVARRVRRQEDEKC